MGIIHIYFSHSNTPHKAFFICVFRAFCVKNEASHALRWNEKMKEWGNEMRFAGMKKWENERVKMTTSLEFFVLHIIVNQEEKKLMVKW